MAGRKQTRQKQGTQKAQDTHEAQEPKVDYTLPSKDKLPPEVADLMQLSFAEIDKLPSEKQQLVYAELGRQAAELIDRTCLTDAMQKAIGMTEITAAAMKKIEEDQTTVLTNFAKAFDSIQDKILRGCEAILQQYDFSKAAEAMQMMAKAGVDLQTYINLLLNLNPERWVHARLPDLYAAAAKLARDDGVDVPPLWFEEQDPDLDLQLFGETNQPESTPAEMIKVIQAINPTKFIIANSALANKLPEAILEGEAGKACRLKVANKDKRKHREEVTIVIAARFDEGIKEKDRRLSGYERQVANAVFSLIEEAKHKGTIHPIITPEMIYKIMPGGGTRLPKAQRDAIEKMLNKGASLWVDADLTEHLRAWKAIGDEDEFTISRHYWDFTRIRVRMKNGNKRKTVEAYCFDKGTPLVLEYSQLTKQLLTVPRKYLNIREVKNGVITPVGIPLTINRVAIVGYMIERILVMKYDEKAATEAYKKNELKRLKNENIEAKPLDSFREIKSRMILFDSIFKAADITDGRTQAMENRDFCLEVLEYWRVSGLIKGYEEQLSGKKIKGILISV